MNKTLALLALAALVFPAPAAAQSAPGMSALQYYVGAWSCAGGRPGGPMDTATFVASMTAPGLMTQIVSVPVQAGMPAVIAQSSAISYDGKGHYNQTTLSNDGSWSVSQAAPWPGNTEDWADVASSDGKLGHERAVRTDDDHFAVTSYASSGTAVFTATCTRQPS